MYIDEFLQHVEAKVGLRSKRVGQGYSVCCPAYDDDNSSLSIKEATDGKILLKCFAGCSSEVICEALGLEMTSLFPEHQINVLRVPKPFIKSKKLLMDINPSPTRQKQNHLF